MPATVLPVVLIGFLVFKTNLNKNPFLIRKMFAFYIGKLW